MNIKNLVVLVLLKGLFVGNAFSAVGNFFYVDLGDSISPEVEEKRLDVSMPEDFFARLGESLFDEKGLDGEFQNFESEIHEAFPEKKGWFSKKTSANYIVDSIKEMNPDSVVAGYNYGYILNFDEMKNCDPKVFTTEHRLHKLLDHLKTKPRENRKKINETEARDLLRVATEGYVAIKHWPFSEKEKTYFELLKKLNDKILIGEASQLFNALCLPGNRFEKSDIFDKHLQLLNLYDFITNKPSEIDFEIRLETDDFFRVFAKSQMNEIVDLFNKAFQTGFQCAVFYGNPGVGKDSMMNKLVDLGVADVYRTGSDLVQLLQEKSLRSDRDMNRFQIITIEGEITREGNPVVKQFLAPNNWGFDESGHLSFVSGLFNKPIPMINTLVLFTTNYSDSAHEFLSEYSEHPLKEFRNVIEFGRFDRKNIEEIAIPNAVRESLEMRLKRMGATDRSFIESYLGEDHANWWNNINEKAAIAESEEAVFIRDIELMKEELFSSLSNSDEITLSMRKLGGETRKLVNFYVRELQSKGE